MQVIDFWFPGDIKQSNKQIIGLWWSLASDVACVYSPAKNYHSSTPTADSMTAHTQLQTTPLSRKHSLSECCYSMLCFDIHNTTSGLHYCTSTPPTHQDTQLYTQKLSAGNNPQALNCLIHTYVCDLSLEEEEDGKSTGGIGRMAFLIWLQVCIEYVKYVWIASAMKSHDCVCMCVSPGEAGSAAKGRSWISHILTLPSSEQDINSLKQRQQLL